LFLQFNGVQSSVPFNVVTGGLGTSAADVQAYLTTAGIGLNATNVSVSGLQGGPFAIMFTGGLGLQDLTTAQNISVGSNSGLGVATVATSVDGSPATAPQVTVIGGPNPTFTVPNVTTTASSTITVPTTANITIGMSVSSFV